MREHKIVNFKNRDFKVVRGGMHPDYSYDTFIKEEADFRNMYWNVQEGEVVFDVGSSYGSYALTACAMGATVYAFEPEKAVFVDLADNVTINNWHSRCFPMNIGLYSKKVVMNMKTYAPHWPSYTITGDYNMETLDHIVNMLQLDKIDWIKIDVEGAEENVIKGGMETIKKFTPNLIVECHTFLDAELNNKIKNLLSSIHNYSFEEITHSHSPHVIVLAKYNKDII